MFDKCIAIFNQIATESEAEAKWTILVVDDDMDVHVATRFCLGNSVVANRRVNLIDVYSRSEAINLLKTNHTVDLILLDVVMETHDAGLEVARWVHEDSGMANKPKIILRTGQPGFHLLSEILQDHHVDAVLQKTSTTYASLLNTVTGLLLETCKDLAREHQ